MLWRESEKAMTFQYFLDTVETIPQGVGWQLYDGVHLFWLCVFVLFLIFTCVRYCRANAAGRTKWRHGLALAIVLDEVWKMVWLTIGNRWDASYLPFHLCSINIILVAIHAWRPSRLLDNFLYLACIPGAAAAMLCCTWTELPPLNFMCLHSFTVHILLTAYPLMLTVGGDLQPSLREVPRSILFVAAMAVPIYFINRALSTNFMFLMEATAGSPLMLFENWFGNHLIGYPFLIAAAVAVMYGLYYGLRRLTRRGQRV